jgi:hypothetical protein
MVLANSGKAALGGGTAGALAMVIQTVSLMWMRTVMNYQYRFGGTLREAFLKLYGEGGIPRLYRGLNWALIQAPMSRFGDTAANALALETLNQYQSTRGLPVALKTFFASLTAGFWRVFLSPVDSYKTAMQVDGSLGPLSAKVKDRGVIALYDGAVASYFATAIGHFPWFATNNYLDRLVPKAKTPLGRMVRSAFIGWLSALVSDVVSNSVRVLKTVVQTEGIGYAEAARSVVKKDGLMGLFGRGLETKLVTNGIQSVLFSILWRYFEQKLTAK